MKLPYKILMLNAGIAIVLGFILGLAFDPGDGLAAGYGIVSLFGGIADLLIGFFLLFKTDKRQAQGFLLSAAFLFITGFLTCSLVL